jgi:hypothetical protein
MNTYPLVSVVIVTYNNEFIIEKCLSSIFESEYPNREVIIVDNASTDKTLNVVKRVVDKYCAWNLVKIVVNSRNYGISKAANIGVVHSKGKYIAFLDSDAFVDPCWLFQPIELMEKNPIVGAVQAKVLKAESFRRNIKIIDSTGGLMDLRLESYSRGSGKIDEGQYGEVDEIFYPIHTGAVIRKDAFLKVGGFDRDFFIDYHDIDLGWRLWIRGYKVVFAPNSIVYHMRGGSRRRPINYYKVHNYLAMILKNAKLGILLKKYFMYASGAAFEALGMFNQKREITLLRFIALFHILKNFKRIYSKRVLAQKLRRTNEKKILAKCSLDALRILGIKSTWKNRLIS